MKNNTIEKIVIGCFVVMILSAVVFVFCLSKFLKSLQSKGVKSIVSEVWNGTVTTNYIDTKSFETNKMKF